MLDVFSELFESPGFLVLMIGIGGFMVRRQCAALQTGQATPKGSERGAGLFAALFGDNYRVAVWIIVMGSVWAGKFVSHVAPWFLAWGK